MILDLFVHHLEGRQISVSALCVTSGLPMTNSLRILDKLLAAGLVRRLADQNDGRRCFVLLEARVAEKLHAYFGGSRSSGNSGESAPGAAAA